MTLSMTKPEPALQSIEVSQSCRSAPHASVEEPAIRDTLAADPFALRGG